MTNRMTRTQLRSSLPETAQDVRYPGNNTVAWTARPAAGPMVRLTYTRFHSTVICVTWATPEGARVARLDTGGWHTIVTARRMNAAICDATGGDGLRVYLKKGRLYVGPRPIVDGEIVTIRPANGAPSPMTPGAFGAVVAWQRKGSRRSTESP